VVLAKQEPEQDPLAAQKAEDRPGADDEEHEAVKRDDRRGAGDQDRIALPPERRCG
jgi:hypothetical protein